MPQLTTKFYSTTGLEPTQQYIETGTYLGNGIRSVLNAYDLIHSIELSLQWYQYNLDLWATNPRVQMHLGDSKQVLPGLLAAIQEPVTVYLDAHYSGGTTAHGTEETPLLAELELLQARPYDDIIIIDDCRLLGAAGTCGAGDADPIYPTMQYDWRNITAEAIAARLKQGYTILSNHDQEWTIGARDQLILVPSC